MSQSSGRDMKRWVCDTCNHIHTGQNPPMICPECEAKQDKFKFRKLTKKDYAKIRRGRKKLPNRGDILILGSSVAAFTSALICSYYGLSVIIMEESSIIGGGDLTGFSEREKNAAFKSLDLSMSEDANMEYMSLSYHELAASMLAFLAYENVLPEFKKSARDPLGAPHPWGTFSESRSLEIAPEVTSPAAKTDLLHQLSYWSTENEVRMLLNHKPKGLIKNKKSDIVGVEVEFNGKDKQYNGDIAILSFLGDKNKELLSNIVDAEEDSPKSVGFKEIEGVSSKNIRNEEELFWGKDSHIGSSMTRAYKAALEIVDEFDYLSEVIQEVQ